MDDGIAKRIKQRRIELGLSLQDVAYDLCISKSTLQRYESGKISGIPLQKLEPLAKALHTSPDWLLGWTDNTESPGLLDRNFTALLTDLGYDLQIYSYGEKINIWECGIGGGPITADEYLQLKNNIYSYIRFNATNLAKLAASRDAKRLDSEYAKMDAFIEFMKNKDKGNDTEQS